MATASRKKFLKLAHARFQNAEDSDKAQRQRERDDLRMYAGDQWPDDVLTSRAGQNASNGMPPVPARPCLTINKVREPVRQILNQERQADLGVSLVPADDFGGQTAPIADEEIELREGLIRKIQRESHANDARSWAFQRAVTAGRGYYGVMTRYVDVPVDVQQPGPGAMDQEIYIQRFYNQFSVTLDPGHEQPDGSDADWGFIGADVPEDQYLAEYGERNGHHNELAGHMDDDRWLALGDEQPGWFSTDNGIRYYRVVDYFYTERDERELAMLSDGSVAWKDDLPKVLPEGLTVVASRHVIHKSIKWAKIDGSDDDVLDETDWPGSYIPIVKVIGEELQPYDQERRAEGMIRPARDSQKAFNYMVSKQVETVGLAPIPPFMVAEGQVEGYEAWYEAANTRTLPYLPYRTSDLRGNQVGAPQRMQVDTPIEAITISVREFDQAIKSTTAVPDPTLGNVDPTLRSGKAIRALLQQSAQGTSHFLDNLIRSLTYEAKIVNDLLYPIYGVRPGRLVHLMNGEGEHEPVLVGQPFTTNGNPRPVPLQPGQQPPPGHAPAQHYQLTKDAGFNITVKVSKAYNTRREEEANSIGELISSAPQIFMPMFGDIWFKNQDGPGHMEMAERAKVMLAPQIQQLVNKDQPQQIPPQVQAQLQQAGQQIQMLSAELQKRTQQLETDAVKESAETERLKMKLAADVYMKQLDVQAKLADSQTKVDAARADAAIEHERAMLEQGHTQAHDAGLQAADQMHQQQLAQQQHDQAMQQAQQGHQQALEQQDQAGQQQAQLAAQQAAQQPQGGQ